MIAATVQSVPCSRRSALVWLLALATLLLLPGSSLAAQQETQSEAEGQAKAVVNGYYQRLLASNCIAGVSITRDTPAGWLEDGLFRPLCDLPPACEGTATDSCMSRETVCSSIAARCDLRATAADRRALLNTLEPLRLADTESDWILAQSINLALKNSELDQAEELGDSCRGSAWWCQALRGYVAHKHFPGSGEQQFDSALAAIPRDTPAWLQTARDLADPGLYCLWTDLTPLLGDGLIGEYERLPCGERGAFERRFWWLSDPLWSTPGNERRSEHLARNVQLRLDGYIRARSPSQHASIVAMGWPNSWRSYVRPLRSDEDPDRMTESLRISHQLYVSGGQSFTPDEARFRNPIASRPEDWAIEWDEGAERMVLGRTWHELEHHQTAVLRRDTALFVVSAARLPVLVSSFEGISSALAMARVEDQRVEVMPALVDATGIARFSGSLASGEWLAGIELMGPDWIGRARYGAPAPALEGGFGVSAPVLVDERFETDQRALADAILPSTILTGRQVGIYFEVYGVERDEPVRISVSAERTNRSLFGRIAGALRLSSNAPASVNWSEASSADMMTRYLALDLDALQAGTYQIRIDVERETGERASSSREVVRR